MERHDRASLATFYVVGPIDVGRMVSLEGDEAHHLRVRRLDVGARIRITNGLGTAGTATVVRLARTHASADVIDVVTDEQPPPFHLLAPIADRDRMLWLAEKGVELGIASWRPVMWHRSRGVSPRGEGLSFQAKVRARMVTALKQSGGMWLPTIHPDATVERAIAAAPGGCRLLLEAAGAPILSRQLAAPVTLALGPEGGMEPDERDAFVAAGFAAVSLVETVLRFETAGVAALAVVRAALATALEDPRDP